MIDTKIHIDQHCHLIRKNLDKFYPQAAYSSPPQEDLFFSTNARSLSDQKRVEGMSSNDFNVIESYIIEEEMAAKRENDIILRIEEMEKKESDVILFEENVPSDTIPIAAA